MDSETLTRLDTRTRLQMLPPVFSLLDMMRIMRISYQTARSYVSRWQDKYSLIEPTGLRTGVFLNLEHLNNEDDYFPVIVSKCLDEQVVEVGKTSFEIHGWIKEGNEQDREFIVAADTKRQTLPTIYGVKILRRPDWWFTSILTSSNQRSENWIADPAMAFADAVLSRAYYDNDMKFFPKPDIGWMPNREDLCGSEIRGGAELRNKMDSVDRRIQSLLEQLGKWQTLNVDIKPILEEYRAQYLNNDVQEFLASLS